MKLITSEECLAKRRDRDAYVLYKSIMHYNGTIQTWSAHDISYVPKYK